MRSIVTDDFLDNPYELIDLSKNQKYYPRNNQQAYEGIRTDNLFNLNLEFVTNIASKIVYNYYDKNKSYNIDGLLLLHKLSNKDLTDPNWINSRIHQDNCILSNILYLNPNAKMSWGTQIYRKENNKHIPDIIYHNKFNRLIQFPGYVDHSAISFDGDEERLTLLFFLEKIEERDKNEQ